MHKWIFASFLMLLPWSSNCQENSDLLFINILTLLAADDEFEERAGTLFEDKNSLFFYYGNLFYEITKQDTIPDVYLWPQKKLQDQNIGCYLHIDSLGQQGDFYLIYFKFTGNRCRPKKPKSVIGKFRLIAETKLELVTLDYCE